AGVESQCSEPSPEADRQRRPVSQGRTIVVQKAIQEWQPDADGRTAQHAAQHPSTGNPAIHVPLSCTCTDSHPDNVTNQSLEMTISSPGWSPGRPSSGCDRACHW